MSWLTPEDFSVGFATLPEPMRGTWQFESFPERVQINGRSFVRSDRWAAPYPHVLRQYREDVDHHSLHLFVHDDGTWTIDHADDANPERGHVLEHALRDVAQTPVGALVITAGAVLLSSAIAYALTSKPASLR